MCVLWCYFLSVLFLFLFRIRTSWRCSTNLNAINKSICTKNISLIIDSRFVLFSSFPHYDNDDWSSSVENCCSRLWVFSTILVMHLFDCCWLLISMRRRLWFILQFSMINWQLMKKNVQPIRREKFALPVRIIHSSCVQITIAWSVVSSLQYGILCSLFVSMLLGWFFKYENIEEKSQQTVERCLIIASNADYSIGNMINF